MSRLFTIGFMALGLLANAPAFANHCPCDKDCASQCQQGKAKHCPCQKGDCSQGGGCQHGQCPTSPDQHR
jgi:hypothetical protein